MPVAGESARVGRVCSGVAEGILLSGAGKWTAGERRQLGDKCHGKTALGGAVICVRSPDSPLYYKLRLVYSYC